jgi:hypothetical protein
MAVGPVHTPTVNRSRRAAASVTRRTSVAGSFRMTETREPAHPDVITRGDERGGVLGRHRLARHVAAPNT